MPDQKRTAFKRLHFFTGFFTTAADWEQGQQYHLEKRKLHLSGLHTPGIIPGNGEELKVTAAGGLKVAVAPGAALDRDGNLLYLHEKQDNIDVTPPQGQAGRVYICIAYGEDLSDTQHNVDYPEYSGKSRVTENPRIFCGPNPQGVELARIELEPGASAINAPINPASPGLNELDTRYATLAGAVDWQRDRLAQQVAAQGADFTKQLDAQRAELQADYRGQVQRLHERLQKAHEMHLAMQRRHNRALYTPGVLLTEPDALAVLAAGGLDVEVRPGAAFDGGGNELYLDQPVRLSVPPPAAPRRVYIVAAYDDRLSAYFQDLELPFDPPPGAAGSRLRTLQVSLADAAPAPTAGIVLAHIDLAAGATAVSDAADPGRPQTNEIDRRALQPARARAVVEKHLPPELRDRVITLMRTKRGAFAALAERFPAAALAAGDVRQAAINLELLARNESLRPLRLAEVLGIFATLEKDAGDKIQSEYPPVAGKTEFKHYQETVAALGQALYAREDPQVLLNRQDDIVAAAGDLAAVTFHAPEANAGPDQQLSTLADQARVTLDASQSQAYDNQKIARYRWDKEE